MRGASIFERIRQSALAWLPNIEPIVLAVLALGTASLWGFIEIAEEVFEGDTEAFDHWVLSLLRNPANPADPVGPRWVEEMARDATALGGIAWLTFTTIVIAIYLWLVGKVLQWQAGYGIVSFGTRDLEWVNEYIRNHRQHHARGTVHERLERITQDDDGHMILAAQANSARMPASGH